MTLDRLIGYVHFVVARTIDIALFPPILFVVTIVGGARITRAAARRSKHFRLAKMPTILCLQPGMINAYNLHGDEILSYFTVPSTASLHILDTASDVEADFSPKAGVRIIGWKPSIWYERLCRLGLRESPCWLRELDTVSRMLEHVMRNGIHFVRSIQHGHSALCGGIVAASFRIPHVVEVAGNYEMLRRIWGTTFYFPWLGSVRGIRVIFRALNNALLGWPLKHAYRVIGRNKNNYEHAFALGASVERLALIRINVAQSFIDEGPYEPPMSGRYMLFVARITTEKFPQDVVVVFEKLARRYPDLSLVMIGDGVLLSAIREQAKATGYGNRIHILGKRPYKDVIRWTRGAAVAFETYSGSALAEKMICSVPVVAYDVEWMSEIVMHNYSGKLARFRDVDAVYRACCELFDDPAHAKDLAQMGAQLAGAMFDQKTIRQQEEQIFNEAFLSAALNHPVRD